MGYKIDRYCVPTRTYFIRISSVQQGSIQRRCLRVVEPVVTVDGRKAGISLQNKNICEGFVNIKSTLILLLVCVICGVGHTYLENCVFTKSNNRTKDYISQLLTSL